MLLESYCTIFELFVLFHHTIKEEIGESNKSNKYWRILLILLNIKNMYVFTGDPCPVEAFRG